MTPGQPIQAQLPIAVAVLSSMFLFGPFVTIQLNNQFTDGHSWKPSI